MFPKTTTTQAIQRNYREIFDEVMEEKEPMVVMVKNKPQVVIVEFHEFEKLQKKAPKKKSKARLEFEKSAKELGDLLIKLHKQGKLKTYSSKELAEQL